MIRKATRRSTAGRIAPPPSQGWRATARESLLQLIYPRWCPVCHTLLPPNAPPLCLTCQSSLGHYDERTIRALDRLRGAHPMPRRLLAPYLYARDDAMALIVHN
ncbi:MAG: ComF family protein, partial [Porphyromonas sp.]